MKRKKNRKYGLHRGSPVLNSDSGLEKRGSFGGSFGGMRRKRQPRQGSREMTSDAVSRE